MISLGANLIGLLQVVYKRASVPKEFNVVRSSTQHSRPLISVDLPRLGQKSYSDLLDKTTTIWERTFGQNLTVCSNNVVMSNADRVPKITSSINIVGRHLSPPKSERAKNHCKDSARESVPSSLHRLAASREYSTYVGFADHRLLGKTLLSYIKGNFIEMFSRPVLSSITTRLMSTSSNQNKQPPSERNKGGTRGSGKPIESDRELLLAGTKGNKRISINVCGNLYSELAHSRPDLYAYTPKGRGIDLKMQYYDTAELLDSKVKAPVVCLLHGAPGKYHDFASQINYLAKKNVRVVAPNFPDYSYTLKYHFRHSPRERVDILNKFFKSLDIQRIDMLIGHSSAVYTMFELLNQNEVEVKSLGLFSTPTYNLPPNMVVTPFRLFTLKLFDYPALRPIIISLIHVFARLQGIQNRVDKSRIENLLIAASAVGYSDSDRMSDHLKLVHKLKLPTFVLYGSNDKLIPVRCFEQLTRDLGIKGNEGIKQYNDEGKLVSDATKINDLVEVSQFESGGHYAFQRFSTQVNEDLYTFLDRKVLKPYEETSKL